MALNTRLKFLRKEVLNLSREEFGKRLGVNGGVIANIELNRLAKPEQKEPIIKLICKEFNVNYPWLKDGIGEMGTPLQSDNFYESFQKLHAEEQELIKALVRYFEKKM